MQRILCVILCLSLWACQGAEPAPGYWDLTDEDIELLVKQAVAVPKPSELALRTAWRWYSETGDAQKALKYGALWYGKHVYPNGQVKVLNKLVPLAAASLTSSEDRAGAWAGFPIESMCSEYRASGFLMDIAERADLYIVDLWNQGLCREADWKRAIVRWLEMLSLISPNQEAVEWGLDRVEEIIPRTDRARLRVAELLRQAHRSRDCREMLKTLARLRPRDTAVQNLFAACRSSF